MHTMQQAGTQKTVSKVGVVDLLQAIKDLNERPDYGSKSGATINPIKELLSFRHQSGHVEYTCFMHARDEAMDEGLVSKEGYRYSLTEAGEIYLQDATSEQDNTSIQPSDQNMTTTV